MQGLWREKQPNDWLIPLFSAFSLQTKRFYSSKNLENKEKESEQENKR